MLETNLLYDNGNKIFTISYIILGSDNLFLTEDNEQEIFNKIDEWYTEWQFEILVEEKELETGKIDEMKWICIWKITNTIDKK